MNIFISHIYEEAALAIVLKDWIESTFLGNCIVFVSSDANSLPAGTRWLEHMDAALQAANVMVVLCSSQSVQRPWVNFETGCAWARDIPVIPVCHTGLAKGNLPRPLAEFQGIDATDDGFPAAFLSALAQHLGISKLPRLDTKAMSSDVETALASVSAGSSSQVVRKEDSTQAIRPAISAESLSILEFLAEQTRPCQLAQLSQLIGSSRQKTEYFIDQLRDAKLISMIINMDHGEMYLLSKEGRNFIFGGVA